MLVGYVISISPNLHYFSIWFVCISTHPTTFFSVLSNFLTSVVSCVTHSLGCEVVSRVSGSLSLFATCTLAFSIHLYAFSTVRLLPPPPPPPPNSLFRSLARSFRRSRARSFVPSFVRLLARRFIPAFVRSFVRSSFGESIVRSFVRRIALPRCLLFFVVDIFFFFDVWSILSFVAGFISFFFRSYAHRSLVQPVFSKLMSTRHYWEILTCRSPYMRDQMKEGVSRQGPHSKGHKEGHDPLVNRMTHQRNDSDRKK